jgi:hypothetical protein
MALSILDGNQSATTLSTILSSGQHITAHTVVSLGTQAISNITSAVSGTSVTFGLVAGTVTANLGLNELPYIKANINITNTSLGITLVTNVFMRRIGQYKYQSISGWAGGEDEAYVEIELKQFEQDQFYWKASSFGGLSNIDIGEFAFANPQNAGGDNGNPFPPTTFSPMTGFTGTMTVSYEQPSTQPISGTVTANTFAVQGTAVTTSNFTSTTASTVLANFNATREVLTIFNEGAGNLHICAGATCTTIAYQVRLSAGDYYEVPNHQTSLTHSAVFATAGTARIVEIS